jgi:hypothetical protein
MVSLEPELTFDEIRDALGLNKSPTSAAINLLLSLPNDPAFSCGQSPSAATPC